MKTCALTLAFSALLAVAGAAAELTEADLAALRYFLSINDADSVAAEIRRLETEFPGADVEATLALIDQKAKEVDTSPIWRRIEAEEFDAARALIAEFAAGNAGWSPPADMLAVLDAKEGQAKFEAAYAAGDLPVAAATLAAFPSILTCDRINNPWRLAELQVAAGLKAEALATYDGILKTCTAEDFVVATLQKANEVAEDAELAALFAVARTRSPMLAVRRSGLEAELMPAPGKRPEAPASAATRPAAAPPSPPKPTVASASLGGGQLSRARAAADRGDWATCLELTAGAGSLDAINQHSWCAFNHGRPREALAGFQRVASSSGNAAMVRDAGYGMVLAYARLGRPEEAAAVASRVELTREQRRVVNRTIISDLAIARFEAGKYRAALSHLDQLSRDGGGLDRGLAMLRGWALLKSGQKSAAREQFRSIHQASPGKDSFQGLIEAR